MPSQRQWENSADDLELLVKQVRDAVRPAPLLSVEDAKRHPNDILLSYLIAEEGLCPGELASLLHKPQLLERRLHAYVPQPRPAQDLPALPDGMRYDYPPHMLREMIQARYPERVALSWSMDNAMLLVADAEELVHRYPSGLECTYTLLLHELSANLSIRDGAYLSTQGGVYVREAFMTMMIAMMSVEYDATLNAAYARGDTLSHHEIKQAMEFSHELIGIILAHELAHIEKGDRAGQESVVDHELACEERSRVILQQNGVDLRQYDLYHELRAGEHNEHGLDISRLVLEQRAQQQ